MGRVLRSKAKVDYAAVTGRYDRYSFISPKKPKRPKIIRINAANGRANAAPPLTSWPPHGMHRDVVYHDDLNNAFGWGVRANNEIFLPFAWLDIHSHAIWQGLEQEVAGLGADAQACQHFDAIAQDMRALLANTRITECVGEAAAAACVLERYPGGNMIWGYHLHWGTGIDQIWEYPRGGGVSDFLIVEAKGPGAGLNFSLFVPPGYSQMEAGWIANHLYSMDNNGHAAGQRIVAAMRMQFVNAHPNYMGASKSYYGLSPTSPHRQSASRVYGMVVTAQWRADGRLGYVPSKRTRYFT
ncbi:hypothetical protein KWH47_12660 [Xanthomonas campestris pv. spermacoces]|uniref:hypothetical protein n=1 Tax=Xanthomonas euvesicatoria TaxID=456327 RepID=UPI001C47F2C3|nr:hypothetical protein [Xanthomonas euvesicatoria]MBV6888395.1 hypothetical protein [Xanthomonas campestris pv. spermacoces]